MRGSNWRMLPAPEFLGLANRGSPRSARSSLSLWKLSMGMYTSPRTSR